MNDQQKANEIPVEEISCWEYHVSPMTHTGNPIRSIVVVIYAKDRTEADWIFHNHAHKVFDENLNLLVKETVRGYRQVMKK